MAGRYQIVEILGSGASAHVCLARRLGDGPDDPPVALKVLRSDLISQGEAARRFRDEHRILALLDHPTVVRGHALLDYDGRLVLEQEFVAGPSIEDQLGALGPLPLPVALTVIRTVGLALHAAYERPGPTGMAANIVHRDLKPGNIAIDVNGAIRLLDFGVAKGQFDDRAAQSLHDVWGTMGYDAPERKQGINNLPSGDVYALGVTLFVMLTQLPMLLSLKIERHQADVDGLLTHLGRSGIEDARVGALIRSMLAYDHRERPNYLEITATIDALLDTSGGETAVLDYAAAELRALYQSRIRVAPADHTAWQSLRFLEEVRPTPQLTRLTRAESSLRVARLLSLPDWENRASELEPILEAADNLDLTPFAAVVQLAVVPVWRFWQTQSRPGAIEAALLVVNRFDTDQAKRLAAPLLQHPVARVVKVAAFVLG